MDWLKKLQQKYKNGKLTKEQYEAQVADLLADGDLTQEEHDKGLQFDPKAPEGGELIYSQEDVDRMAVNVARRLIRKEFKDAGITLDADNKSLLAHIVGLVKGDGDNKGGDGKVDEKELAQLRKDAAKVKDLENKLQDFALENAVLRGTGTTKAINPTQVVRALRDYADDIEYDDNGVPEKRSLDLVMRKLAKAEPNLFKPGEEEGEEPGDDDSGGKGSGTFQGKPPGGGAGNTGGGNKSKEDQAIAEALERMGLKQSQQ